MVEDVGVLFLYFSYFFFNRVFLRHGFQGFTLFWGFSRMFCSLSSFLLGFSLG